MSSSSSDDDVLNLLPTGGGARGGMQRPPPRRNRDFKVAIDSDSDTDVKHKPVAAAAAATRGRAAAPPPPASDSDDSDDSTVSINFEPQAPASGGNVAARSESPSSATEINFKPEVVTSVKATAAGAKVRASSTSSSASSSKASFKPVPTSPSPAPVAAKEPTPAPPAPAPVVASPASVVSVPAFANQPAVSSPPPAAPAPKKESTAPPSIEQHPNTMHQTPASPPPPQATSATTPPSTVSQSFQQQPAVGRAPPTAPQSHLNPNPVAPSAQMVVHEDPHRMAMSSTPIRSREVRPDTSVDELLARAQQRLRDRQYNTSSAQPGGRAPSPSVAARVGTPHRSIASPGGTARYGSVGRSVHANTTNTAPPLAPPDFTKENRTQKENQRLADEVTFLSSENHRLRNQPGIVTAASTVEITKLELQLEVTKKQCRDLEVEAQRVRRVLEEQVRDISEHRNTLQDEVAACLKSISQFEQMARDKDAQLIQEQAMTMRIKHDLAEAQQESSRLRDDLNRLGIEWSAKLDRNLSLLEDMKRQRNHLTELNDKLTRDKDIAVNERKRLFDEVRQLSTDRAREKEAANDEMSALKREIERYRAMLQEKERVLNVQLIEERKAKDALQSKLLEIEGNANKETKSLDVQLRAQQDEHRRVTQRLQDQLHQVTSELRQARQEADELREMLGHRNERERFDQQQEYNDHVFRLRKEVDDHLVALRNAESARDLALRDCDRLREELKNATSVVSQWKAAKERLEAQNHQLTTTISLLMDTDDGHSNEKEQFKAQLEEQEAEIRRLQSELEQAYEMEHRLSDMVAENERLTAECNRLAGERDELVDENGKMATEVLKWRDEVKDMLLRNNKIGSGGLGTRPSFNGTSTLGYGRR